MTQPEIVACMAVLESSCGREFGKDDPKVWRSVLGHLPYPAVMDACKRFSLDGDGFPTTSKINKLASEAMHGTPQAVPDVWPQVLQCVRRFGLYQTEEARAALPPLVWKALGGNVGWQWLCDMEPDDRATFAAQFRDRYRELREAEKRDRALPEHLRPKINDETSRELPEPAPEVRKLVERTASGIQSVDDSPPSPGAERYAASVARRLENKERPPIQQTEEQAATVRAEQERRLKERLAKRESA